MFALQFANSLVAVSAPPPSSQNRQATSSLTQVITNHASTSISVSSPFGGVAVKTTTTNESWSWLPLSQAISSVYLRTASSVSYEGSTIQGADPVSFEVAYDPSSSDLTYARDKNHVYWGYDIGAEAYLVTDADPNTFTPIYDVDGHYTDYAKDNYHVYVHNFVFLGDQQHVDPASFKVMQWPEPERGYTSGFSKDKNHVYTWDGVLEDANPATFTTIGAVPFAPGAHNGPVYAKDGTHIFVSNGRQPPAIVPADMLTFEISAYSASANYDASDKDHFFRDGVIIQTATQ